MSSILEVTLGVVTAMGGFVDIGELVFAVGAGAKFGFDLIWAVVIGAIGIITYGEMCGRVAAVSHRPVFDLIRERLGLGEGLIVLVASTLVNVLTCAAEVGGVAIAFQLLTNLGFPSAVLLVVVLLILVIWVLPFNFIEKVFGILGLILLTFMGVAWMTHPSWLDISQGLIPTLPKGLGVKDILVYIYFAVGLIGSTMMPYEVYFYSSGGIEDKWAIKDLIVNKATSIFGFSLGALMSISLIVVGAQIFKPLNIDPQILGTTALTAAMPFGKIGLIFGIIGIIFVVSGAALETALAGAYSISQFFGFEWGRYKGPTHTPRFTVLWVAIFIVAYLINLLGVNPVNLVEYSVIFSVVALPFTYIPILAIANDETYLGKFKNGPIANIFGWIYLIIISIVAVLAVPMMILSNMGQG